MAISETEIQHLISLHNAYALTDIRAVCDLGQQEVHFTKHPKMRGICAQFAMRLGRPGVDIADCGSTADMWRRLGRTVVSLDLVGAGEDFRRFDLNSEQVPDQLRGQFDLVTNCGTSEHIINQHNVFKVMHDLTRHNGVMFHVVPIAGFTNHGLINYNLKMFTAIAKANGYMPLDFRVGVDARRHALDPDLKALVRNFPSFKNVRSRGYPWKAQRGLRDFVSTNAVAQVLLRKIDDVPFRVPLDVPEPVAVA